MELPALHRKISANELVEASINTAFLNHFDSSHKYVEFNHHHSDDGSYSNLLQRYEELAIEHLKLKRKYENVINDLHYKTMNSVDETVELKHTILGLWPFELPLDPHMFDKSSPSDTQMIPK